MNLGIRFGGTPPDDVIALARGFDVYSMNKYRWAPPKDFIDRVYAITKLPILIGEFHFGVPERGLAPGLVQTASQAERGVAYSYYVEHAAEHPAIVGAHWYQWIDQPATGRRDGENYNIGWIDVTDRPYPELVAAAKATHSKLDALHAGKLPRDHAQAAGLRIRDAGGFDSSRNSGDSVSAGAGGPEPPLVSCPSTRNR